MRFVPLTCCAAALSLLFGCGSSDDGSDPIAPGTEPAAPAAPTPLGLEPMDGGLHVTWTDASDDEDEFVLERAADDGDFVEVVRVPFDSDNYHDAPLTSGVSYTYRVGAVNPAGESWSIEASQTVP